MINNECVFSSHSSSIEVIDAFSSTRVDAQNLHSALLETLKTDDLALFKTLLAQSELSIADYLFDNNQNCFHVAVESGSHSILGYLAESAHPRVDKVINRRDASRYTPLMCAAVKGDEISAKQLIDAGASAPYALCAVIHKDGLSEEARAKAVSILRSLGADISQALAFAVASKRIPVMHVLILLGANCSNALISAALSNKTLDLYLLERAGANIVTPLIKLSKKVDNAKALAAAKVLITESVTVDFDEAALRVLAKQEDIAAMRRLLPLVDCESLSCDELVESGNVKAVKILLSFDLLHPNSLERFIRDRKFGAVITLIKAGMSPPLTLLEKLVWQDDSQSREALKLLIVAGADLSTLNSMPIQKITKDIDERRTAISALSPAKKYRALFDAICQKDVTYAALLLEHGANPVAALKDSRVKWDSNALDTFVSVSTNLAEVLIDLVSSDVIEVARALLRERDVSTQALIATVEKGNHESARAIVRLSLTNGAPALVYAAQSDNEAWAKTLMSLGANGPAALLQTLRSHDYETASRLIAWGVDIHATLMLTYRGEDKPARVHGRSITIIRSELRIMGAELPLALLCAIKDDDADIAGQLIQEDESVKPAVIQILLQDKARPAANRAWVLKWLISEQFINVNDLVISVAGNPLQKARLKSLMALGASTARLRMDLDPPRTKSIAMQQFQVGGDLAFSMKQLIENSEGHAIQGKPDFAERDQNAANTLALALATLALPPTNPSQYV